MSIAAAVRNAYGAEIAGESPQFATAAAAPPADTALERVTEWIPTEAVGIYIGLLGIFTPKGAGRWVIFGIGAAAVLGFVLLNTSIMNQRGARAWANQGKPRPAPKLSRRRFWIVIALVGIAYLTWAWALPGSPFLDLTSDATRIGAAAGVVYAPFLPKIAKRFDVRPPT